MRRAMLLCLLATGLLGLTAGTASAAELADDIRPATAQEQARMEALSRKEQPSVTYTYSNARVSPSHEIGAIDTASAYGNYVEIFVVLEDEINLFASIKTPVNCLSSHEAGAWDVDVEALGLVAPDQCSEGLSPFLKRIRVKSFDRKLKAYNRAVDIANRRNKRVCKKKRSTKAVLRCARSTFERYPHAEGEELTILAEDFAATVSWASCKEALLDFYTNQEAAMDARLAGINLQLKGDWIGGMMAYDDEAKAARKARQNARTIRDWCPAP